MHLRCEVFRAGGLRLDQPVADALHLCILQHVSWFKWMHTIVPGMLQTDRCCARSRCTEAVRTAAPCGLPPPSPAAARTCPATGSAQWPSYDPALLPPSAARPPARARQCVASYVIHRPGADAQADTSAIAMRAGNTGTCRNCTPQHARSYNRQLLALKHDVIGSVASLCSTWLAAGKAKPEKSMMSRFRVEACSPASVIHGVHRTIAATGKTADLSASTPGHSSTWPLRLYSTSCSSSMSSSRPGILDSLKCTAVNRGRTASFGARASHERVNVLHVHHRQQQTFTRTCGQHTIRNVTQLRALALQRTCRHITIVLCSAVFSLCTCLRGYICADMYRTSCTVVAVLPAGASGGL